MKRIARLPALGDTAAAPQDSPVAQAHGFGDVQGDRKQFIEELLGQPLGENQQVYILVRPEQRPDRSVSMPATGRDRAVVGGQK